MDIKRKDNKFLPDDSELKEILETEVFYPIAAGKENKHYPKFETIINLLNYLNLPIDIFIKQLPDVNAVVSEGKILLDKIVQKNFDFGDRMLISVFEKMYDYLSEQDKLEKCDTVFIFGAKTPLRAIKGAEVFKSIGADRIIVSGGSPFYGKEKNKPEALTYKEILLENGISESSIIIEDKAITLPDNVRRSLKLFDELGIKPKCMALVNSPYSQRRGWAIFKKHLSDDVKLIRVNCNTAIARDNWYRTEDNFRIILNEFVKMRASIIYNTA